MPRHSKIQVQVLGLYRQFLKAAKDRPGVSEHIKHQFKRNAVIPKTDSLRIEHLIRQAERQLQMLKKSNVQAIGVFQDDKNSRKE